MPSFSHLSNADIEARIVRLREIIAQNEMIKGALNDLLAERGRRKAPQTRGTLSDRTIDRILRRVGEREEIK